MIPKRQLLYIPCLALGAFFLFLKGGVYASLLDIGGFGELSKLFLIVNTLVMFGAFGMQLLGHKVLPMYYAKSDYQQIASLLLSALSVYVVISLIIGVVGTAIFLVWDPFAIPEIWVVLLIGVSQFSVLLLLIDIKSRLNFLGNATASMLRALCLLLLGGVAAWLLRNFLAVLLAEALVNFLILGTILSKSQTYQILRSYFDIGKMLVWTRIHIKGAIKLVILSLSTIALFSIDKWSGFFVLDNKQYGIYALGLIVLTTFEMLQRMVNVAAYPTMSHMIGRGDYRSARRIAVIALALAIGACALLYYPGILMVNLVIDHFLEKYAKAKLIIDILIIAGTLRLADFFSSYCILCNLEILLSKLQVFWSALIVITIIVLYFFKLFDFTPLTLAWIALGTSLLNILTSIVLAIKFDARQHHVVMQSNTPGMS